MTVKLRGTIKKLRKKTREICATLYVPRKWVKLYLTSKEYKNFKKKYVLYKIWPPIRLQNKKKPRTYAYFWDLEEFLRENK